MLENRIYERQKTNVKGRMLNVEDLDEAQIEAQDYSLTGIKVSTYKYLPAGSQVKIWLNTEKSKEIFCSGKVIWTKEKSTDSQIYETGIEFLDYKIKIYRALELTT